MIFSVPDRQRNLGMVKPHIRAPNSQAPALRVEFIVLNESQNL